MSDQKFAVLAKITEMLARLPPEARKEILDNLCALFLTEDGEAVLSSEELSKHDESTTLA